jgi:hypothetical protein
LAETQENFKEEELWPEVFQQEVGGSNSIPKLGIPCALCAANLWVTLKSKKPKK